MAEQKKKKVTKKILAKDLSSDYIDTATNVYADREGDVGEIRRELRISAEHKSKFDKQAANQATHIANEIISECLTICEPINQFPKLLLFWDSKKSNDVEVINNINKFISKTGYDFSDLYHLDNETFSKIKKPNQDDIDYDGYKFIKYVRNKMMTEGLDKRDCFNEIRQIIFYYNSTKATSYTLEVFLKQLIYDYLAEKIKEAKKEFKKSFYIVAIATLIVYFFEGVLIALGLGIISTLFMLPIIFRAYATSELTLSNPMSASYFNLKQDFDALKRAKIKVDPQLDNIINEIDKEK